jgi:HD-like signal output (HDOD) protein
VTAFQQNKQGPLWQAEKEVLGATHAEVGACLLGLWGLPHAIVEATAWHHTPAEVHTETFTLLAAVHGASALAGTRGNSQSEPAWDLAFLRQLHVAENLPYWKQLARAAS